MEEFSDLSKQKSSSVRFGTTEEKRRIDKRTTTFIHRKLPSISMVALGIEEKYNCVAQVIYKKIRRAFAARFFSSPVIEHLISLPRRSRAFQKRS